MTYFDIYTVHCKHIQNKQKKKKQVVNEKTGAQSGSFGQLRGALIPLIKRQVLKGNAETLSWGD